MRGGSVNEFIEDLYYGFEQVSSTEERYFLFRV